MVAGLRRPQSARVPAAAQGQERLEVVLDPDRVAWGWAGAVDRRVGRRPSQVHGSGRVGIGGAAERGLPWRSLPPNSGRCHGPAGQRGRRRASVVLSSVGRRSAVGVVLHHHLDHAAAR